LDLNNLDLVLNLFSGAMGRIPVGNYPRFSILDS